MLEQFVAAKTPLKSIQSGCNYGQVKWACKLAHQKVSKNLFMLK